MTLVASRAAAAPSVVAPSRRSVTVACLLAAAAALVAALVGIGVPATYVASAAVDETEYLLSAVSLWEDGDLDISDERAEERWRDFSDVRPSPQSKALADGRQLSPHDPLLSLLLAFPVGLFGWVGAKVALSMLAAAAAALTVWVAVRRFGVRVGLASVGTALLFGSAPLAVYGQQVYPELPAALAVLIAVAALTSPSVRASAVGLVLAVTALPWLGVKYLPVAAVLAVLGLVSLARGGRWRVGVVTSAVLVAASVVYLAVHQLVWGGWTVYASGDHFQATGEFSVVGVTPNYAGRSLRLVGLLVDREFGLVAWQPAWLLLVPAAAALVRARQWVLVLPITAGWATATWIALTMHGFWFPGRQVVVVLPLAVIVVLVWLSRLHSRLMTVAAGVLGLAGLLTYALVMLAGWRGELTWVFDFAAVDAPTYRALRPLLPDYRSGDVLVPHLAWVVVLLCLVVLGWRTFPRKRPD